MKIIRYVVQRKTYICTTPASPSYLMPQFLSVYYDVQGRRHYQGGTRSERFHCRQGLHSSLSSILGIWHPTRLSGYRLQVLLHAQVGVTCLFLLITVCPCGREPWVVHRWVIFRMFLSKHADDGQGCFKPQYLPQLTIYVFNKTLGCCIGFSVTQQSPVACITVLDI